MPLTRGPAPTNAEIIERSLKDNQFTGYASVPMDDWMNSIDTALNAASSTVSTPVVVPSSGASIGTTPITNEVLTSGLYRVSYYLKETQADNVGSSITVNISWTDGGITRTLSGAALTANSTAAAQTGTLLLQTDGGVPITYSTTYATTGGAPPMLYALVIVLERVS